MVEQLAAHTGETRTEAVRRHPAGLNFGDCLCYAAARATALPILCTGEDFARTDVEGVRV